MKTRTKAFTLIELLVVISILGILMGIIGPKVIDLLSGSEKTKMQAILRGWVTQLHQYKSHYGYFPPFLSSVEEGTPISLSEQENYENFMISLKGKTMTDKGGGHRSRLPILKILKEKNSTLFQMMNFTFLMIHCLF